MIDMRAILLTLLFLAIASCRTSAQTTGIVQGTVTDEFTGQPLSGVTVLASSSAVQARSTTDRNGFFVFLSLPPGPVTVAAVAEGYHPSAIRDVCVESGITRFLRIWLDNRSRSVNPLWLTTYPQWQC